MPNHVSSKQTQTGTREGWDRGWGLLIFMAEVRNNIMTLINKIIFVLCLITSAFIICIQVPSPLCCINNQHDFKGWGENQRIMLHDKT